MNAALLYSIATTGFAVAFFHAALPTHWLPFVVVGRAQQWSGRKVALVTAAAGAAHVAFTVLLGALVALAGAALERWTGGADLLAAALLFGLGAWYLVRHVRRRPGANGEPVQRRYSSDAAAVGALVLLLTLSPCEAFLPVYLSAAPFGVGGFALLSLVLAIGTAGGMALFTTVFALGWSRLKLSVLERYESAVLGGVLILLGVAVLLLER